MFYNISSKIFLFLLENYILKVFKESMIILNNLEVFKLFLKFNRKIVKLLAILIFTIEGV